MKQILFILILINSILVSQAQKANIEYGFQSGLNISSAHGEGIAKDYKSILPGLHVGGHVTIHTTEKWGLKFLPSYDQVGWKYTSVMLENSTSTGLVEADVLFKLNYLNLPIVTQYSFGKKVKMYVDAGFFAGILLNNKIITKLKEPVPPNQDAIPESSSNDRSKINFGLSIGSGIQIPLASKLTLDFGVRNNQGLANIYKSESSNKSTIKTNTFTIAAGLSFML